MTPAEQAAWIAQAEKLTREYHSDAPEPRCEYELERYNEYVCHTDFKKFITPMWQEHYDHAEELLRAGNKEILNDDLIRYCFFLTGGNKWLDIQVPYLKQHWSETELHRLLKEDHEFYPTITNHEYDTSECLVHHLTHFTFFREKMSFDYQSVAKVVEFGGGYGGMCRLLRKINCNTTHIIIDLPVFLFFQSYYIRSIFGEDQINWILSESAPIVEGKVNLIPVELAEHYGPLSGFEPDLFIATWSLSEANDVTQKMVFDRDYFGAKHLLMAYRHYKQINPRQPFSDAIELTPRYDEVYRGLIFYALADEQHYFFARRK